MNEWISVKDRLPEENESVLAVRNISGRFVVGNFFHNECGWILDGWKIKRTEFDDIEYWMPLPPPPEATK